MLVVSDTSPLRAMSCLHLIDVLAQLFDEWVVPPTVHRELSVHVPGLPRLDAQTLAFARIQMPQNAALVESLCESLDRGEAEAIALAVELQPVAILIDERAGRRAAATMGLRVIGTLGLLDLAKRRSAVAAVRPLVERLCREMNFAISPQLAEKFYRQCGE